MICRRFLGLKLKKNVDKLFLIIGLFGLGFGVNKGFGLKRQVTPDTVDSAPAINLTPTNNLLTLCNLSNPTRLLLWQPANPALISAGTYNSLIANDTVSSLGLFLKKISSSGTITMNNTSAVSATEDIVNTGSVFDCC